MLPSEAYEILGVDRQTTAKEMRRAYLRLLKKFRPESDPEGFKRVRQAYELLRDGVAWGGYQSEPVESASEGLDAEHTEATPTETNYDGSPGRGAGALWDDFYQADDVDAKIAVGESAIDQFPDDADSYYILHEALVGASKHKQALTLFRRARERGLHGFAAAIMIAHANEITEIEVGQARSAMTGTSMHEAFIIALIERGSLQVAYGEISLLLDAMESGGRDDPNAGAVLDIALHFFCRAPKQARIILTRLQNWMHQSVEDGNPSDGWLGPKLALAEELSNASQRVSVDFVGILARWMLDDELEDCEAEVRQWVGQALPGLRENVRVELSRHAPTLWSMFESFWPAVPGGPSSNRQNRWQERGFSPTHLVGALLVALLYFLVPRAGTPEPEPVMHSFPRSFQRVRAPDAGPTVSDTLLPRPRMQISNPEIYASGSATMKVHTVRFYRELDNKDCNGAHRSLRLIDQEYKIALDLEAPNVALRLDIESLQKRMRDRCRAVRNGADFNPDRDYP